MVKHSTKPPKGRDRDPSDETREKATLCAYHVLRGETFAAAAKKAKVNERTFRNWRGKTWWPDVVAEAETRWFDGLRGRVRRSLDVHVPVDGALALRVGERLNMGLEPASQRHQVEHSGQVTKIERHIVDTNEGDAHDD